MRGTTLAAGAVLLTASLAACTSSSSAKSGPAATSSSATPAATATTPTSTTGLDGAPPEGSTSRPAIAPGGPSVAGSPAAPSPTSSSAANFLDLVLPVDMHLVALGDALSGSASAVQSNAASAVVIESSLIRALTTASWPTTATSSIARLVKAEKVVLADLHALATQVKPEPSTVSTLKSDQRSASSAAHDVRVSLKLPVAAAANGALAVL